MQALRKLYKSICLRAYSVGRLEYENRQIEALSDRASFPKSVSFYSSANIFNESRQRSRIIIGPHSHIYGSLIVYPKCGAIQMGEYCSLGESSRIVSGFNIKIGNRVMIAHNVNIIDNNSHPIDAKLRHEDFVTAYTIGMQEYDLSAREIIVEDDVWIGFNSIILKGVTIGRGAIIGAGSVVTQDVAPWTVNVGNPLRCVKELEPQIM